MSLLRKKYTLSYSEFFIHFLGFTKKLHFHKKYRKYVQKIQHARMRKKVRTISKHDKIRVGFLVSEQSKWGYSSVYDSFAKSDKYEPVILVTKLVSQHQGGESYYKTIQDCYDAFKNMGYNVEIAYDEEKHQYIPLNKFNVDIVFYQQPWELAACQHPLNVSEYAITAYVAYGFELIDHITLYMEFFHRWLDFFFTPSDETAAYINSFAPDVTNMYISGYPKMDAYFDVKLKKTKKPVIIYAPHHSFEADSLNMATFQYNGLDILKLAQETSDQFDWLFKPHPRFKHAVVTNNIMTQDEIESYYKTWKKFGRVYEGGDYINIFANSAAMITDCCSFLAEYLPSGKPLFHLLNPKERFNNVAKSFICSYYPISDSKELVKEFNRVIVQGDDYKQAERISKIPIVFNKQQHAGENIFNILNNTVFSRKK